MISVEAVARASVVNHCLNANWGGERAVDKHSTVYLHGQMTSVKAIPVVNHCLHANWGEERVVDKHSTVYLQGQTTSVEAVARDSVVQSLPPRELGRREGSR